jgi:hypothetical protein
MGANLRSTISELLPQRKNCFHILQAPGTLQDVNFKIVSRGGIQLPVEVLFRELAPMQFLTFHGQDDKWRQPLLL